MSLPGTAVGGRSPALPAEWFFSGSSRLTHPWLTELAINGLNVPQL